MHKLIFLRQSSCLLFDVWGFSWVWVGLGHGSISPPGSGLGWVGSVCLWVGLGRGLWKWTHGQLWDRCVISVADVEVVGLTGLYTAGRSTAQDRWVIGHKVDRCAVQLSSEQICQHKTLLIEYKLECVFHCLLLLFNSCFKFYMNMNINMNKRTLKERLVSNVLCWQICSLPSCTVHLSTL